MRRAAVRDANGDEAIPDLSARGKPLEWSVKLPDGTRSPYLFPQTKWDNCADLQRELEPNRPTDEDLTRWHLTRREYEYFLRFAGARPTAGRPEP